MLLTGFLGWDANAIAPVAVVCAAMALFFWWRVHRGAQAPQATAEEASTLGEIAEDTPDEEPDEEPDATATEGPGQLLVRFQTLSKDFEQATKELHRYNGSREIQLQGWQQLSADVIRRILPVLDNLEPYLDDTDSSAAVVAQLAYGRLLTELVTIGVTQIIPVSGEPFDGNYHLLGVESKGYPPYRIKSVVQPGYRFQPRIPGASEIVLKPAEVVVESEIEPAAEELPEEESMEATVLERVPAVTELDDDDEDIIEIHRMPLPDEDDDEVGTEVKRIPYTLTDEE